MKKLFVVVFMLVATVTLATAQQGQGQRGQGGQFTGTVEERAKAQDDLLAALITGLTAEQKERLKVVNLEIARQQDVIRQNNQGNMEAMRTASQRLEETRETRYRDILTVAQLRVYTEDRARRQQQRGQGGPGGGNRN